MKIYIVETRNGTKVIYNENKLVKLLSDEDQGRHDLNHIHITELEAEVKEEITGLDYFTRLKSKLDRDNKLEVTLGDGYAEDVERLKQMIIDKVKPGPQKDSFLKRLEITPFVKKDISALLRGFGSYILYEFPLTFDDSLEYYKLVLKLHKFRKIEDKFVRENYDSSGYLHSRGYCVTPDRIKDCFNTVKSEIVN